MEEGLTGPHDADRASTEPTGQPTGQSTERRATVGDAAGTLGITAEAVRSRIKRGTLRSVKEGGTVYVLLEGNDTNWFQSTDQTTTERDRTNDQASREHDLTDDRAALVDVLHDQVEYLREQLGEEREARRRADMLLARLSEANASMAGQIRELMVPQSGLRDAESGAAIGEPSKDTPEASTASQTVIQEPGGEEETTRRPWWVRWFGG